MFVVLLLFVISEISGNERGFRCSKSNRTWFTFEPAPDNTVGRYVGEMCVPWSPKAHTLKIDVSGYSNESYCRAPHKGFKLPNFHHSVDTWDVSAQQPNCTHVCYSSTFDLIFNACYYILSELKYTKRHPDFINFYKVINDSFTQEQIQPKHNASTPHNVDFVNHENGVSVTWISSIPITDFNVSMAKKAENPVVHNVLENCTLRQQDKVECFLSPPYGNYSLYLDVVAPWSSGMFSRWSHAQYDFNFKAPSVPVVSGGHSTWRSVWVSVTLCVSALCAVLVVLVMRRTMLHKHYSKRLIETLRKTRDLESPPAVSRDSRPVLLLYAREDERGQRAVDALREHLQRATGGPVLDIFSPCVQAQYSICPASWIQQQLANTNVRVVLLQTPALAALYGTRLPIDGPVQSPLLGERVMYQSPEFGDQLLSLALRLLAETASAHHEYHKYYIATYSSLPTETVPCLVPYRRYLLPDAAMLLTSHLSATCDVTTDPHLATYIDDYVAHVKEHPDYLMDELRLL